jgi:hypothetical protein
LLHPSLLQNESLLELHYWFAQCLTALRPEHLVCVATPSPTVIRALALAFLKVLDPAISLAGDVEQILKLVQVLKEEVPLPHFDRLAERAPELRALCSPQAIEEWMEGVKLSTTRAALVLTNDIETTAKLLTLEGADGSVEHRQRVKKRLQELMVFAVSESYFTLRKVLGLQIE